MACLAAATARREKKRTTPSNVFPAGAHGYRHAFVFRWLSSARQFYLDNHAMKLHARLEEQKEAREAAAREKKKRERTALFTGPFSGV